MDACWHVEQLTVHTVTVPPEAAPTRLDVFLAHTLSDCTRRAAQQVIAQGSVRVNGRRARKGQTVKPGDRIQVPDELCQAAALQPNPALQVAVLYEDAAIIVVDKPAGMPSHALRRDETGTVANFLLARHPELTSVGKSPLEPGIVHRLDTDTSGVLLAARTQEAYRRLRQQFAERQVVKDYMALVVGDLRAAGDVCAPLAHHRRDRRMMRVCTADDTARDARAAVTSYRPVERFGSHTLLAVRIRTGVMHQIRVHLASIGHPVVNDRVYGAAAPSPAAGRHCLHACHLQFFHPSTGQRMEVSSSLPPDFAALVEGLRQKTTGLAGCRRKGPS